MGVIFVAGVHGVGKSTCCSAARDALSVSYFSASEIIRAEMVSAIDVRSKIVRDIAGNQDLLVRGIEAQLDLAASSFLLDGHFTVIGAKKEIVDVSIDIFRRLRLDAVVVYRDKPESILLRMIERDGICNQVAHIEAHQNAELSHAHRVASILQIPFVCLEAFNFEGLQEVIRKIWNSVPIRHSSSAP